MSTDHPPLVLGRVSSVYGVKGWVRLYSYTDPIEKILTYPDLLMRLPNQMAWQPVAVQQGRRQSKGLVAHLAGYDDRDAAQMLCGSTLAIAYSDLPPLTQGEYYWHQLEGLQVYTLKQQYLGRISHMLSAGGANDVMVIEPAPGSIDQRQRLIPYLVDQVVKQVDLAQQQVSVDWDAQF